MDISYLLNSLNKAQCEAVTAPAGHHLILAGAGSGKTRVLVHRIAWLIQAEGVSPHRILAVTFTNKAAGEMRERIEALLGMPAGKLWIGTFHSIAHRLLRLHWREAGLPQSFQIIDSEDQLRIVKQILKQINLDESRWPARRVQWYINARKDEGLRPASLVNNEDPRKHHLIQAYRTYEEFCARSGMVDFAELLLRAHELWHDNPTLLAHYRERFPYILVDEFQDTNAIQYGWVRLLAGTRGSPFIVGDDDQSIYGWRGAKVENLNQLKVDFPALTTLRLEQNYRSTGTILAAANAVIANNVGRLGKKLWTEGDKGNPIQIYRADDEQDEATFIVERIQHWVKQGGTRSEIAILYRSNAQSRAFEETLMAAGIPYRIYGGVRFFERAEVKDALAFLRLIINRDDGAAFERIINRPARGIGARTLERLRETARVQRLSLWNASVSLVENNTLASRSGNAVRGFMTLIDHLATETRSLELHHQVEHVIRESGLLKYYQEEKDERSKTRLENLKELINAARHFILKLSLETPPLMEFLTHATLEAGERQSDTGEDCVQLMTLHSAKGLEFPLVFIVGLEEGLFPSVRSLDDPARLEEERRLCYVGMTRARYHLYLTHAECRWLYGTTNYPEPSRFIREIPTKFTHEAKPRAFEATLSDACNTGLRLGQSVKHPKFGQGIILNLEGKGAQTRAQVNFSQAGTKWLVVACAKLQAL